jgi:hypothetical protein
MNMAQAAEYAVAIAISFFLLGEILILCLHGIAAWKLKKLRAINAEVNRLTQDDDHWKSLLDELSGLDDVELGKWIYKMRVEVSQVGLITSGTGELACPSAWISTFPIR